jgi:hypothetical protein
MRIEWRYSKQSGDALVAVDESANTPLVVWEASSGSLADFLNDMAESRDRSTRAPHGIAAKAPEDLGDLVVARSDDGEVQWVNPELYWERVAAVFRARGEDPHQWRTNRP